MTTSARALVLFLLAGCGATTPPMHGDDAGVAVAIDAGVAGDASSITADAAVVAHVGGWDATRLPDIPSDGTAVAPFMYEGNTKHVAMVEIAPGQIAVYGGDYTGAPYEDSYRQDAWTLDVASNSWSRRAVYERSDVHPHRPDTMGVAWDAQKQRILFVPGVLTEGDQEVWSHYADDHWVQETQGFGGTGMIRGGVADWQTRRWLSFSQSATLGTVVNEWDVDTWTRLAETPWPGQTATSTEYVEQSLPTIVGRYVYFVAREVRTDGTMPPRFYRWSIDARAVEALADPPVPGNVPESTLLATSGTTVVWPYILGPEGVITKVLLYDTAAGIWSEDTSRPALDAPNEFLMNSICSLSDGSVFMAGSVFGATRQTHWFLRHP